MTPLKEVQEAIVTVVPEIAQLKEPGFTDVTTRPITLEDVLEAIDVAQKFSPFAQFVTTSGDFYREGKLQATWTLGQPLHLQPGPTITFLHSIFYPNNN